MEIHSFILSHIHAHYKKLLIFCTATASIYLIKRYMDKKKLSQTKKEKKKIKDFPTIEEIQKFIEDLPFEAVTSGKEVSLRDLLGELSEFSEDEDWKELIASVHSMYKENNDTGKKETNEDTGSIMSIYEDPNLVTLNGPSPRDDNVDFKSVESSSNLNESKGTGDVGNEVLTEKNGRDDLELLVLNLGEGDISETV